MTDFEQMKRFFEEHQGRLVGYEVIDSATRRTADLDEGECKGIANNPCVKDFFVLHFPFDSRSNLVDIDSLDSFTFEICFVDYGDKIVIHDAGRTFDCGVKAYEGNGVIGAHKTVVDRYLERNGMECDDWAVTKETSLATFARDTITFVKALQTLNNAQPFPPYLLELDAASEVADVLSRCWIKGERMVKEDGARRVAIFDNQKILQEHFTCGEQAYPRGFNKHKFVGLFFNSDGKVLLRRRKNDAWDFAVNDYVLEDEWSSLCGLQRAVKERFGFDFFFGDVAPALTTTRDKLICDFYVVTDYNVEIEQLCGDGEDAFAWVEREELMALQAKNDFALYSPYLIDYVYDIKGQSI